MFLRLCTIILCICICTICNGYTRYEVEDLCIDGKLDIPLSKNGTKSALVLKATRYISYKFAIHCQILLKAFPGQGVVVSIREVGFRMAIDGTCQDWLKIFYQSGGSEESVTLCQSTLDLDEAQSYSSDNKTNVMKLEYYTDQTGLDNKTMSGYPGFELTATAYYFGDSEHSAGRRGLFQCSNGRFIWEDLQCDGHNNCGDMSDESGEGPSNCGIPGRKIMPFVIAGCVVAMLLFVACILSVVCWKKKRPRQVLIRLRRQRGSGAPIIEARQMF